MSQDFSWDKVLGSEQSETPGHSVSDALNEILNALDAPEQQTADTGEAAETPLTAVEGGLSTEQGEPAASEGKVDPYAMKPLPRNLVEPDKTNVSFDAEYRPDFVKEKEMEEMSQAARDRANDAHKIQPVPEEIKNAGKSKKDSNFFVAEGLQTPRAEVVSDLKPVKDTHIDEVLKDALDRKASDIHFTAGLPPMARIDGEIVPLNYEVLGPEHTKRLLYDILTDDNIQKFESTHELDFAYTAKGMARFRVNAFVQRHAVAAALRMIPNRIPTYEDLRLPPVIREIAKRSSGLVLVTGPTGSGKSTTIAAMIDDINNARQAHILTVEDPIEYLHSHKKCMVNQREMHSDTYSFHNALRAVLREDPDIILVGELRDLETIEAALTLAETGHLVFGTLHTRNAPSTIDRVVDVFPSGQQAQIRVLLSNTIEGIISQQLLPKLGGGRVASLEIMIGVPAIKNLIREAKTHQMYSVIETNRQIGMQTMDNNLADLFKMGYVSYDECMMRAVDKETFAHLAKAA